MLSWSKWQQAEPQRTTALFIPEDIYHCIFAHIIHDDVERSLVSALTQVCKFFAFIFMPVLLGSRSIPLDPGSSISNALLRSDPLVCSQILHVKRCTIFYPPSSPLFPLHFEPSVDLLQSIIRTLPRTLKSLTLENIPIDGDILTALHPLTNLTSLTIDTAVLSSTLAVLSSTLAANSKSQSTVKLDLSSFSFRHCTFGIESLTTQRRSLFLRPLISLINFDAIRSLTTNDAHFLHSVITHNRDKTLPGIEELSLSLTYKGQFYNLNDLLLFLAQMPNLTTLSIDIDYVNQHMTTPSSMPGLVPKLAKLRSPPFLAPYLIPGRPLTDIVIYRANGEVYTPSELQLLIQKTGAPSTTWNQGSLL
jgi:hypothetical protein